MTFGRLSLVQSGLLLTTGIVWMVWQHRVHSNVLQLGVRGARRSPSRGVVCWMVPLANAVLPYLVILRLWKALTGPVAEGQGASPPASGAGAVVDSRLTATNLGVITSGVQTTGEILLWGLVSSAASMIAALLAQEVVKAIQRRHDFLAGVAERPRGKRAWRLQPADIARMRRRLPYQGPPTATRECRAH